MRNTYQKKLKKLWKTDAYYSRTITSWFLGTTQPLVRISRFLMPHGTGLSVFFLIGVFAIYVLFPTVANADIEQEQIHLDSQVVALIIEQMQNETRPYGKLTQAADAPARQIFEVPVTAYTSEVGQTDDTPCITASGLDVCARNQENVVAANFLPIGTRIRMPELYGDRVFYVEDRMNKRYHHKMDVWMKEKADAKEFGVKFVKVEVF